MPSKNKSVKKHNTEGQQQTILEPYKRLDKYKKLVIVKDDISTQIRDLYENNHWNLMKMIDNALRFFNEDMDYSTVSPFKEGVQYLEFSPNTTEKIYIRSLKKLKAGDYADVFTNGKNTLETEKKYAQAVEFWTKTFDPFKKYQNQDSLSWVFENHRELFFEIFNYHNEKKNSIATFGAALTNLLRIIKLQVGEDHELRYKYSVLQVNIKDLEAIREDDNQFVSQQEAAGFVQHEQLIDILERLEQKFKDELKQLPYSVRIDGTKHPAQLFHLHQVTLLLAMYVYDYPSRNEKTSMMFITDINQKEEGKNYVLIEPICTLIFGEVKKKHKPIEYKLASKTLPFNVKLNRMLKESYSTYPRKHLFISQKGWPTNLNGVTEDTVSSWLRKLVDGKSLNIPGLRSSFATYWYDKMTNRQKIIMAFRMRTSKEMLERNYVKKLDTDNLIKVKTEPTDDFVAKASAGTTKETAYPVKDNNNIRRAIPALPPPRQTNININIGEMKRPNTVEEQAKKNMEKYMEKNKEKHQEKMRSNDTYTKRFLRELNSGKKKNILDSTIKKYGLYQDDNDVWKSNKY
jgi:hypothetical protein